jgi:esterase/lipase superfamily enzyme
MQEDAARMKELFAYKDIPAWVDFWGKDVCHDWSWWKQQLPYFMNYVC